ncbi:MAG: MFS transporter [Thiotrichaceae bacterium]|nr:MFS transporter [Thiotrichaceae bacterium]PCI10874.1 MAG: MFS transporter [Thiotrichales bacterium]PCI13349.1 MAG: MFS transporter [Thiotrichales bacterium]
MSKPDEGAPYWRLSGFYFFYFAALGALLPYWGLYLQSLGFGAREIGELIAILMATKIVAPNIWGWIADHTGRRMMIVRLGSLLSVIAFGGIFLGISYWWMACVICLFSFFWNATLPQFEATTMSHLGGNIHRYSNVRLWGSVGFIVAVVVVGPLLEARGVDLLPLVLVMLFVAIWFSSLAVPERAAGHLPLDHEPLINVLRQPIVVALLVICFLVQMGHGPYYTFFTIYLGDIGYSSRTIGLLWALGVVAEIGAFLVMHRLFPRFGVRRLLLVALALTTLRWLLVAWWAESLAVMLFAQLLHAFSFGVFHAVAISLIHQYFVGRHQGKGQALYSSVSFGAGGAIGSLYSGYTWEGLGPSWTFLFAAAVSFLAFCIAWKKIHIKYEEK